MKVMRLAWFCCLGLTGLSASADNLLTNGSFELGSPIILENHPRMRFNGIYGWSCPAMYKKELGGVAGNSCLFINRELESNCLQLAAGKTYTFSVYLKSMDGQVASVDIGIIQARGESERSGARTTVIATPEWKRFSLSCPVDDERLRAVTISPKGCWIYVDAAQFELGDKTTVFATAANAEGYVQVTNDINNVFFPSQKVELKTTVAKYPECEGGTTLVYNIEDFYGRNVEHKEKTLEFADKAETTDTIAFSTEETGAYRVEVAMTNSGKTHYSETSFLVVPVPQAYDEYNRKSFFGIEGLITPDNVELAQKLGAKWWRVMDFDATAFTNWKNAEPEKGKFVWRDDLVELLLKHKMSIMGTFLRTAKWASSAPESVLQDDWMHCNYPPKQMDDWRDFVAAMVRHYQSKIDCWEVWNEAWGSFFIGGSPEYYVKFLEAAYVEAKKVNPSCTIVGGGGFSGLTSSWTDRFFAADGDRYMDIADCHASPGYIAAVKQLLEQSGRNLPIWATETDVLSWTPYKHLAGAPQKVLRYVSQPSDSKEAASRVVRDITAYIENGASLYSLYFIGEGHPSNKIGWYTSLRDYDGTPKPYGAAYAVLANKIDNAEPLGCVSGLCEGLVANLFRRGKALIAVVHCKESSMGKAKIFLPYINDDMQLSNLMGNRINPGGDKQLDVGDEPVYMQTEKLDATSFEGFLRKCRLAGCLPKAVNAKFEKLGLDSFPKALSEAVYITQAQVARTVPMFLFESKDATLLLAWNEGEQQVVLHLPLDAERLSGSDIIGQPVACRAEADGCAFTLENTFPSVIRVNGLQAAALGKALQEAEIEGVPLVAIQRPFITAGKLRVPLLNNLNKGAAGEMEASIASEGAKLTSQTIKEFTLAPLGQTDVEFPVAVQATGSDELKVKVKTPSAEHEDTLKIFRSRHARKHIEVDGSLGDWNLSNPVELNKLVLGSRNDDTDMSGTMYSCWDELNIYFAISVSDNMVVQKRKTSQMYNGDCVELFFNVSPDGKGDSSSLLWKTDVQLFISPKTDDIGNDQCYVNNAIQFMDERSMRYASRRTDTGYVIEIAIPVRSFCYVGGTGKPGIAMGFDAAIDDADETGIRKAQMVWAGAMDNYKNTSNFGTLILIE